MAQTQDENVLRRKKALYRAQHRGTKEMDWMLGRFADARLVSMEPAELELFEQLVLLPDPDIHQWLLEPETCSQPIFRALIDRIRTFNDLV